LIASTKLGSLAWSGVNSNDLARCAVSSSFCEIANAHSLRAEVSETEISSQEEVDMHHGSRYLFNSLLLTAALTAPTAIMAATRQQDNGRQEENHRDDKDRNRFYDRDHRDYHNWNDNEDHSYRLYLGERHREYRPFAEVKQKEQRAYWKWRHSHPDHD
jgi:hypothetical protein